MERLVIARWRYAYLAHWLTKRLAPPAGLTPKRALNLPPIRHR